MINGKRNGRGEILRSSRIKECSKTFKGCKAPVPQSPAPHPKTSHPVKKKKKKKKNFITLAKDVLKLGIL